MVKFCLQCKDAFWGGQYCPKCPGEIELLDAALPENKKYLPELHIRSKILTHYLQGNPEFLHPTFSGLPKKPSEILTHL